jgi:hypothetical protein
MKIHKKNLKKSHKIVFPINNQSQKNYNIFTQLNPIQYFSIIFLFMKLYILTDFSIRASIFKVRDGIYIFIYKYLY